MGRALKDKAGTSSVQKSLLALAGQDEPDDEEPPPPPPGAPPLENRPKPVQPFQNQFQPRQAIPQPQIQVRRRFLPDSGLLYKI